MTQTWLFDPMPSATEAQPDLRDYDLVLINSSAGKDSQAMLSHVVALGDAAGVDRSKFVVVHADLGRVEWEGTLELARTQAEKLGLRFEVVRRDEDLLDHVLTRNANLRARTDADGNPIDDGKAPAWPSSAARWCTSDHKTSQVVKLITRLVDELDPKRLGRRVRILNCLGIRAAESVARSKKTPFGLDPANWSKPPVVALPARPATAKRQAVPARLGREGVEHGRRQVDRWLPIFHWTEDEVWTEIRRSGLPHHPAYDAGMTRLSCVFCVLASKSDLVRAAQLRPDLAQVYVEVEQQVGHRFRNDLSMAEIVATAATTAA